jgi:hypothetical protein
MYRYNGIHHVSFSKADSVMNYRLTAARIYIPAALKRRKLCSLFSLTAGAFSLQVPVLDPFSYDKILHLYAVFTREAVECSIRNGVELRTIQRRLFDGGCEMGDEVRRELRISSFSEAMRAAKILYCAIGIDFRAKSAGEVSVTHCFFSNFYSGAVCRVISSLDEGLIAGLTGNGRLIFSQRMTEGLPLCAGRIEM